MPYYIISHGSSHRDKWSLCEEQCQCRPPAKKKKLMKIDHLFAIRDCIIEKAFDECLMERIRACLTSSPAAAVRACDC